MPHFLHAVAALFCSSHSCRCTLLNGLFAVCCLWSILPSCILVVSFMWLPIVRTFVALNAKPQATCLYLAGVVVDILSTQDISAHIEYWKSYNVTLYNGRLDAKALKRLWLRMAWCLRNSMVLFPLLTWME